ncbi:hypothetical protein Cgig2_015232 [Carnegiea gigantea]|uniref:Uncharacterized protein n=1 Tax=Carnegiea gigantea TaxID=171969 RepID=A0A9Q1QKG0_9CARY|nr:hypothetical protein Cgig2_015232 [Carnegiea gigantea]
MGSSSPEREKGERQSEKATRVKKGLGWIEWLRGWLNVIFEMLFQRIAASHLQNPMPLPPVNNLTCIVTGSTSGIGREIARQLAESGAHVVMAVRNPKAAHELIQKWQTEWSGKGLPLNIEVMELNLLSLDSVARFAEAWNSRSGPLHVLINNAGIFSIGEPQKFSKDGHEEHMQVNHLAPALLSVLLLPSLIRGSPSRIINVNSVMHYVGFVDPEDMNVVMGKRKYTSLVGYSSSKLAQIMFSSVLQKQLPAESGINVVCVSPGIVQTNVVSSMNLSFLCIMYFFFRFAASYLLCRRGIFLELYKPHIVLYHISYLVPKKVGVATDPQVPEYCELLKADNWPTCAFISQDCRPTNPSEEAHNTETAYRLWEKTLEMIGLHSDVVERLTEGGEATCCYGNNEQE